MQVILTTERLYLRKYQEEDVAALFPILSDPTTMAFWPKPYDKPQVLNWITRAMESYAKNGFGRWAVIRKEDDTLIGCCGFFRAEVNGVVENDIGYIIHHRYWKMGYAYEASKACLEYGLNELKMDRVIANMPTDHHGSKRVAEKIGLQQETVFINHNNRGIDTYLFSNR